MTLSSGPGKLIPMTGYINTFSNGKMISHCIMLHPARSLSLHFAYPFGNRRAAEAREFNIAAQCGFKTAMTTRIGNIFSLYSAHLNTLPGYDITQISLPHDLALVAIGTRSMRVNRLRRVIST
jgi:hypothetical protein